MISDERLAVRAKEGDQLAFETLSVRLRSMLRALARARYATGLDRGDLDQEADLALWRACRSFDPARGVPFGALAHLVVTRHLDTAVKTALRLKHRALNSALSLDYAAGDFDDPFSEVIESTFSRDPFKVLADREDIATVTRVLTQELSDLERETAVGLMNGESYADIERRLGISDLAPGQKAKVVDNSISRVRRKVLVALGEEPRPLGVAA